MHTIFEFETLEAVVHFRNLNHEVIATQFQNKPTILMQKETNAKNKN